MCLATLLLLVVPKNAPKILHQPRGERFSDQCFDHVLTMRIIALHGAGEGFLAASVVETGVQESALKCLNCPVESVFLNMLFDHQKKLSTGLVKPFLLVV